MLSYPITTLTCYCRCNFFSVMLSLLTKSFVILEKGSFQTKSIILYTIYK